MISISNIITLIGAYLLGSIPSAVWVGLIFYKIDVREYGSGNAGATNTFRVLGWKAGIPVLAFDTFKGWACVKLLVVILARFNFVMEGSEEYMNVQLGSGIACLMGHIFPIYAGFRGGKGVATLLGLMLGIHPQAADICILIFIGCLLITQYVSLSSMIAGVSFPFILIYGYHNDFLILSLFSMLIAALVVVTHQKNIERLFRGAEPKAKIFRRKAKS
ncbi:MAG: glycerol-3-phosphate 1-O-acyltransferase PlsY [Bacteroidota bacterium]